MTGEITVAIIGNRDQTALMRLAGVEKYRIIENEEDAIPEKVREALTQLAGDRSIGIIMIPENWGRYAADTMKHLRESKRSSAIMIEIPEGFRIKEPDVKEYYKTYTKKLIGFNVNF
ncbi:MAG TPA: V-type ATP synthase subunit F [Syntrophales bacterium]|nr:V-type ATP synthase subunit F [Syntrophales bacterium]HPQ45604.1 V-type ATP synthase subunit F [Syntrophales bacterium]